MQVKAGYVKKIAPRIYTSNLNDTPESIIRRNLFPILGQLYPGALLSHRSALEFQPTQDGKIFLTYTYSKRITIPGVTLCFLKGPGPVKGDTIFMGNLFVSQQERALLENLQSGRDTGQTGKTLSKNDIENKLEQIVRVRGEKGLNEVRDKARILAAELEMTDEYKKLDRLIGAILSTRPSKILSSPQAQARAFGFPYDPLRIQLFEKLFSALNRGEYSFRPDPNSNPQAFRNFAFYESYFSNYIEGTVFTVDEALKIIETGVPLPARNEDSHDILGTFRLVCNQTEMGVIPSTSDDLIRILQYRHQVLMYARPEKNPGNFKDKNNRAGETWFVDFELVRGTLSKGYEFYRALNHPFTRAVFIMFLVSEVHPFLDGNGRIARIMMNAELVNRNQSKIIIPNVYRDDYITSLRRLSRQDDPVPFIAMMERAHEFSKTISGDDAGQLLKKLTASNAFRDPEEATLRIIT